MKPIITCTLLLFLTLTAKADTIILNGDTCRFWYNNPLKQYPGYSGLIDKLVGFGSEPCFDCYVQGYDAEWTIIDNNLYLTNIYSEYGAKSKLKADINKLFNVTDGKVKADWLTLEIWVPIGKEAGWLNMMTAIFMAEKHLIITKGHITAIKQFNYPSNSGSVYIKSADSLNNFIYSHIQWDKLAKLNDNQKVLINFTTGPSGKPENVNILKPIPESPWAEEVKRVISLIPWPPYYWHGELKQRSWGIPIIFSEAARKKYAH